MVVRNLHVLEYLNVKEILSLVNELNIYGEIEKQNWM